jgi:leader peptidase (prepilin peptidase)/N-methyltransferase
MTGLEGGSLLAAVVGLVTAAGAGWWCPAVLARLPEPEPDPEPEPESDADPESGHGSDVDEPGRFTRAPALAKTLYVDLARRPGLGLGLAVASGVLGAAVGLRVGLSWDLLVALPLVPVVVLLAYVDWQTTFLPTRIIAPAYGVALATILVAGLASDAHDDIVRAAIGWAIYGGFFFGFWYVFPGGWGYGDVRLSGLLGLVLGYLGWPQLYVGLMSGVLLGGFGGAALGIVHRSLRRRYPYGPFMVAGALIGILVGHAITNALGYQSLMG